MNIWRHYPCQKEIKKEAHCHSENNLTVLFLKMFTLVNNGLGKLDIYLFVY